MSINNDQWVDVQTLVFVENNLLQWATEGLEAGAYYQVWSDDNYVYVVTDVGLEIYDMSSESKCAYIEYVGGFSTIWGNDSKIFCGTTNSGVKYIEKSCISGDTEDPTNLVSCLSSFSSLTPYANDISNNIIYLHGYENTLGIVTNSSVDIIKIDPYGYKSSASIGGMSKCFMDSCERFYYLEDTAVHRVDTVLVDWNNPSESYTVGSGIFNAGIEINDIYCQSNIVYAATTSGVYVIDEVADDFSVYYIE